MVKNEFLYSITIYDNNSTLYWQITTNDFATILYNRKGKLPWSYCNLLAVKQVKCLYA